MIDIIKVDTKADYLSRSWLAPLSALLQNKTLMTAVQLALGRHGEWRDVPSPIVQRAVARKAASALAQTTKAKGARGRGVDLEAQKRKERDREHKASERKRKKGCDLRK